MGRMGSMMSRVCGMIGRMGRMCPVRGMGRMGVVCRVFAGLGRACSVYVCHGCSL